jgi:hypothetical protein
MDLRSRCDAENQSVPPYMPPLPPLDRATPAALLEAVRDLSRQLRDHAAEERQMWERIATAFPTRPDGRRDYDGHHDYHAAMIDEARDRARLWRDLRAQLLTRGTIGLLSVIAALIAFWWHHGRP